MPKKIIVFQKWKDQKYFFGFMVKTCGCENASRTGAHDLRLFFFFKAPVGMIGIVDFLPNVFPCFLLEMNKCTQFLG